jgi:DNA-binding FadR family transcriptional regulator
VDDPIARRLGTGPVAVPRAAELIVEDLRGRIASGELPDGARLPGNAVLMERYGVSNPTLREALRMLASESLLELPTRNSGARVLRPSAAVAARHVSMLLAGRGSTLADVRRMRAVYAGPGPGNRTLELIVELADALLEQQAEDRADGAPDAAEQVADLVPWTGRLPSAGRDATGLTGDVERVARSLRSRIVAGDLPAGSRLPAEAELMQEFAVSRVSLRSAVRMLESDGLMVVRRGARGGAEVTTPRITQSARYLGMLVRSQGVTLGDYLQARALTAPALSAAAVAGMDDAGRERLAAAVARERAAADAGDPGALTRAAFDFYRVVGGLAGSVALDVIGEMLDRVVAERALAIRVSEHDRRSLLAPHREWARAAAEGDVAAAGRLWAELTGAEVTRLLTIFGGDVPVGAD